MDDAVAGFVIERLMKWGGLRIYRYPGGATNGIAAAQCKGGDEGALRRAAPAA